jgi:conjugal transfer pilus assembly protein TraF
MHIFKKISYLFVLLAGVVPLCAQAGTVEKAALLSEYPAIDKMLSSSPAGREKTFWQDAKRGWFYYEQTGTPADEKTVDKTPPVLRIDWARFKELQAREISALIDELKDFSITYPTKDNVETYMIAQRIAAQKAHKYMTVWQQVLRENPALDETVKRPPTSFVSFQLTNALRDARRQAVEKIAADRSYGLILFYSEDNYYSGIQLPVVRRFVENTGWAPYLLLKIEENAALAKEYGVQTLPEIWLVRKDGKRSRVTAGARTADVIEENIVRAFEEITGEKVLQDPFKFTEETDLVNIMDKSDGDDGNS